MHHSAPFHADQLSVKVKGWWVITTGFQLSMLMLFFLFCYYFGKKKPGRYSTFPSALQILCVYLQLSNIICSSLWFLKWPYMTNLKSSYLLKHATVEYANLCPRKGRGRGQQSLTHFVKAAIWAAVFPVYIAYAAWHRQRFLPTQNFVGFLLKVYSALKTNNFEDLCTWNCLFEFSQYCRSKYGVWSFAMHFYRRIMVQIKIMHKL